jgi:sorbitol-specific phosphotransferase system component IIC
LYYYLVESARIDGKRMTGLMFPDLQFRDLFQKGGANDTSSMTGLMPFYILAFLQMPASHGT